MQGSDYLAMRESVFEQVQYLGCIFVHFPKVGSRPFLSECLAAYIQFGLVERGVNSSRDEECDCELRRSEDTGNYQSKFVNCYLRFV